MERVSHQEVEHARLGVQWLHLLVGLHRARNAADALEERAIRNVLEQLIVLAGDEAGRS